MVIKRKRDPHSLPDKLVLEPSQAARGKFTQPVAAYFASRFRPDQNIKSCTWQVYQNPQKKQLILGRAVRLLITFLHDCDRLLPYGPAATAQRLAAAKCARTLFDSCICCFICVRSLT